jgi:ATP-binding cassette subfamily C exporter for protease/lipase
MIPRAHNEIIDQLVAYKRIFRSVAFFTAVMNLLLLAPSLYMLDVYDRVLTSRNEYTLLLLSAIILFLFVIYAMLEMVRSHAVIEVSKKIDAKLNERVYTAAFEQNLKREGINAGQALNDLTTMRQFVTGPALYAFFDFPWFPIYLLIIFLFNFWLGVFSVVSTIILITLAYINELITHEPLSEANILALQSSNLASNNLRNAETLESMGMLQGIKILWLEKHTKFMAAQSLASQRAANIGAITKFFRTATQSLVLGLAAYLVLQNELSAGMMIAATILLGKTLAPIESVIAAWKQWRGVLSAYERLNKLLEDNPPRSIGMSLPRPIGNISLDHVYAAAPGTQGAILKDISINLEPGDVLGVVGPSASGKSTLAKILVGVWEAVPRCVRIDGADAYLWNKDELGSALGYMPQEIDLLPGSVSQNIARFTKFESEDVISAAKTAGVHEMILKFPKGYDSLVGGGNLILSGGQKQRIALARAIFGKPNIVVLDEPNSNLDEAGEIALINAIEELKTRKATTVVITHRTSLLKTTTKLLVLQDGMVRHYGPTEQVLKVLQEQMRNSSTSLESRKQ